MRKLLKPNLWQKVFYNYPRRTVQATAPNDIWACDLVDMNSEQLSKSGYILNCVDVYSRYAQSVKLRTVKKKVNEKYVQYKGKSKECIEDGFVRIFELFGHKPKKIWFDKESGVISLKSWLNEKGIELYHVENSYMGPDTHSVSIAERFNRTMREAMFKYKSQLPPRTWNQLMIYTINNFIPEYNHKIHSTIGVSPHEAYKGNKDFVKEFVDEKHKERANEPKKEPKQMLKIGDFVFLQKAQEIIRGKKETKYYDVPYEISGINKTNPTTYTIKPTDKKQKDYGNTGFYKQQFILPK